MKHHVTPLFVALLAAAPLAHAEIHYYLVDSIAEKSTSADLRAEAREQQKTLRAHWAHLVVHGALHLIGYDHEREAEASRMERREIRVLRRLGFANPYRSS